MSELMVKKVSFNGDTLLAVKNEKNGKVYVGVKWVCKGLGLTDDQTKNERKKIQSDIVLSKGGSNLTLLTNGGNQDVLCIELDYLPLWLAKISITPNMIKESETQKLENGENYNTVVDKLIEYQLKAKDVLADAFIKNKLPSTYKEALLQLIAEIEEKERLEEENKVLLPKAEGYDKFIDAKNNQTMNDVAKVLDVGRNKLFNFLRNKNVLMSNNTPYQRYCDSGHFVVKESTIQKGIYIVNTATTYVTSKGVDYIRKLLEEVNYNI